MPQRQGSGASLRFYSNVRAYLDLGFDVDVIQVAQQADGSEPSRDLAPVKWKRIIERAASPTLIGRLSFRAGMPNRAAFQYYYSLHRVIQREINNRFEHEPGALFHLEGEHMASVIPWLSKSIRCIWSLHDLPSAVVSATTRIACEAQDRAPAQTEQRELRFAEKAERVVASHAPLILCIADTDRERLRSEWNAQIEYLPMSIPGDGQTRIDGWLRDDRLRILHLGSVSHLPSYRSLEFLFEQVFPQMPESLLERIEMDVVGTVDDQNPRTKRILELARKYSNVTFHGFVSDVVPFYRKSDVQVVASTDATGLRTRTIESFAYGLPVLSTSVGARGIAGLRPGEQLLIADDSRAFVENLSRLLKSPELLSKLSRSGREFYEKNQSRKAVALKLSEYLQQYFGITSELVDNHEIETEVDHVSA